MKSLGHVRLFATCVGLHPTGLQGLYLPSFKAKEPGVRDRKINGLMQQSLTFLAPRTGFLEDHFSRAGDRGVVQVVMGAMGRGRWRSITHSPTAHLLQSCLVPNSMQAGPGPQSGGWGPWFSGRESLHVWSKVLEHHTVCLTVCSRLRAGHSGSLDFQREGEIAHCRGTGVRWAH